MSAQRPLVSLIANLAGRIAPVGLALLAFPIYLHRLGVANFGIIAVHTFLATLAGIFDVAFTNTINRELAQSQRNDGAVGEAFRTLEVLAWVTAAVVGVGVSLIAPWIAGHWLKAAEYPQTDVVSAIRLMSLLLVLQAPFSFYCGALYGLHRHDLINSITIAGGVLSTLAAVATVTFVSATVEAYLWAQFSGRVLSLVTSALVAYGLLRRHIPGVVFRISLEASRRLGRFALGMNGLGALNLVGGQADMVILSRLLSATNFGYYAVAKTVSQNLIGLAMAAYQSAFPHLASLTGSTDSSSFRNAFHRFCQFLTLLLVPASLFTCVLSRQILAIWTGDHLLAERTYSTLSILAISALLYGLNVLFSAVQMAHGAVRQLLGLSSLFVSLLVPGVFLAAKSHGPEGAAYACLSASVVLLAVSTATTFLSLLEGEFRRWISVDLVPAAMAALLPCLLLRPFVEPERTATAVVLLFGGALISLACAAGALPEGRSLVVAGRNVGLRILRGRRA